MQKIKLCKRLIDRIFSNVKLETAMPSNVPIVVHIPLNGEKAMKKTPNPVAKFAGKFNKSTVEVNRKRRAKLGYQKHRKPGPDRASFLLRIPA